MTLPTLPLRPFGLATLFRSVPALWCAFALVHVTLMIVANTNAPGLYGDPHLYGWWIYRGVTFGDWPVINADSVYPLGALIPLSIPAIVTPDGGEDFEAYRVAYELLVVLMNGLALGSLVHASRRAPRPPRREGVPDASPAGEPYTAGAWWWLVFLLFLGPISLTRLDGVSAALTVIALAQLLGSRTHPEGRVPLASGLATLGAWIKIAPGAVWLALLATTRRPWRRVAVPALVTTGALVVPAALAILSTRDGAGGLGRLVSFLGEQDGRGLQSESVGATPFSVARLWGSDHVVRFNEDLSTWEIAGPGTSSTASVLGPALVLVVAAITALTWWIARRVRTAVPDESDQRLPLLELTLFATMVLTLFLFVLNKVGSPQFAAWFAPPVAVALTALRPTDPGTTTWRSWRTLAIVLPVVAVLTQILFPSGYSGFISGEPADVVVAAVRNAIVVALALWAVIRLVRWRVPSSPTALGDDAPGDRETTGVDTVHS